MWKRGKTRKRGRWDIKSYFSTVQFSSQAQLNVPIALNARYIKLEVMEAEDEVDDELSEAADTEVIK